MVGTCVGVPSYREACLQPAGHQRACAERQQPWFMAACAGARSRWRALRVSGTAVGQVMEARHIYR